MRHAISTIAAGLALSAALLGAPAHAVDASACTSGSALCFNLQDRPATAAELGIPVRTSSVVQMPDCERWSAINGARTNFRGLCSEGPTHMDGPGEPETPNDPGGPPGTPGGFTSEPPNPAT